MLLLILELAGRPVQRLELMKWSFLLRHETASKGGSSFYDFVPYRFGPFSFALYQEIQRLVELNYLLEEDDQTWRINPEPVGSPLELAPSVEKEVRRLFSRLARFSANQLVDYVYERHPEFTVNSERAKLRTRPTADVAVFTAGYEGISVDCFLNLLVQNGVERLIDVRNNPTSRRYGFHKSTLARLSNKLGIQYAHFPELGIRSEKRQLFPPDGDRAALFDEYEGTTLLIEKAALEAVSKLVTERPSVLVCMEAAPECCHRSRLAYRIAGTTNLPIRHLRP
ncbi:MAG: DUF488 family protein [Isosphaeraceae bacterium]